MKSNIEIVKDYLNGVRPVIMVGYNGKKHVKHAVGETWTDEKGQEWEQLESGPRKVNRMANAVREAIGVQKCKCGQNIKWGSKRDRIFYDKTGMCEDCLIQYETKLRIVGIYPDYETYKMASNELGGMKEFKAKVEETIAYFSGNDTDITMLCNSEGFTERWKTTNKDQILETANNDLKEINRRIEALTKIRDEYKQKYEDAASKFKLEMICQTEKPAIKT
jgi:hypothetical protein